MMADHSTSRTQRSSLRQSLRNLLRRRRHRTTVQRPKTIGSGILRKAGSIAPILPSISEISLFPDFGSSTFNFNDFPNPAPASLSPYIARSDVSPADKSSTYSIDMRKPSLLPLTRLSHLNLRETYFATVSGAQVQCQSVSSSLSYGASRKASLATIYEVSTPPSSILRIQSSESLACSARESRSRASLRRVPTFTNVDTCYPTSTPNPEPTKPHIQSSNPRQPTLSVPTISVSPPLDDDSDCMNTRHFTSFCVLDTSVTGYPVTATSEDLRYVFEVGDQFFLHNEEVSGSSVDVVTGFDADGNEVTHLVLFTPLISPSSGRSRFLLSALIDVTPFLRDAARMPELETISEDSLFDTSPPTPVTPASSGNIWRSPRHELSADDLLGGCFLEETEEKAGTGMQKTKDAGDVWLNLAIEEQRRPVKNTNSRTSSPSLSSGTFSSTSRMSTVDNVLEDFMADLQQLYSTFFLLAKSPLDHNFYEIVNVSPTLFASGEYVNGHLSRTPRAKIVELSGRLGGDSPFSMQVNWGTKAMLLQLYCVPLFGQSSITWVCLLVGQDRPLLW